MDRNLTESAWKAFAKGGDYKDAPLLKALSALAKADKAGPDEQLEALDDLDRQIKALRSAGKGQKDLLAQLEKMDRAAETQRKESEDQKKNAAKERNEEEAEEDSPALLTSKLVPLVREVRKGKASLATLVAVAGNQAAVMISRRTIAPARGKLLKDYLGVSAGVKLYPGQVLLEGNALTFVLAAPAAGMAKKLREALLRQVELRLKVRVRGEKGPAEEDGEDLVEDDAAGALGPQGQAPSETTASPEQQRYRVRREAIDKLADIALRDERGDVRRITALRTLAGEKAEGGNYVAALQALDALEATLRAALQAPAPGAPGSAPAPDAETLKRDLADMAKRIQAASGADPSARATLAKLAGAAGAALKADDLEQALRLSDQLRVALQQAVPGASSPRTTPGGPTSDDSRDAPGIRVAKGLIQWNNTRSHVDQQIRKLQAAILRQAVREPDFPAIQANLGRLGAILEVLDDRLTEKLGELQAERDAAAKTRLAEEARLILRDYQAYVESDPLVGDIDDNGFVPLDIKATVMSTLDDMSRLI